MINTQTRPDQKTISSKRVPRVTITHYADPWCWWSWGLEPVLARLKEVYQDQLKVVYRMGGMASTKDGWLKANGANEESLSSWIENSVEFSRNPVNPGYFELSGFESSFPASLAIIAATRQDEKLAGRFFRRLLEAFQVEARPASRGTISEVAAEVGLNPGELLSFASTLAAESLFAGERASMRSAQVNFLSLVIEVDDKSEVVGESFDSSDYENAIDRMAPGLFKRQPADILEYMEKVDGHFVSAKELSEVFQIPMESVRAKLIRLEESDAVTRAEIGVPDLWQYGSLAAADFNEEIIRMSHVVPGDIASQGDLEAIVGSAVKSLYTQVAENPGGQFHFPPGFVSALHVGYSLTELEQIPASAVESFAGVGNPFVANVIEPGDTVLDIGSGSGTDALLSAVTTGDAGKVTGLDITPAMSAKARSNAAIGGFSNVEIIEGEATNIPVATGSTDVVTSNGVLNLVVDKPRAFAEIFRVIRPGGWLQVADIVSDTSVAAVCGINPQLWADCVGGAATEEEFLQLLNNSGFDEIEILDQRDYFEISDSETTRGLTQNFGVRSIVVRARKSLT